MVKYQWNNLHSAFFSTLVGQLNHNNVKYFILRNYEQLPEHNIGKDVDIVIEPGKYQTAANSLKATMMFLNITYYTVTQFDRMRCWYIMDIKKNFGIHIDIIENENYKGFEFFKFKELYTHVIKYKSFYVLGPAMDCAMLLIQNIVAYKSLKEKYQVKISETYSSNKKEIDSILFNFFGHEIGKEITDLLNQNNYVKIIAHAKKYEATAMKQILKKRPFYTSRNIIRFLVGKFYRLIICPQKFWRFFAVEAPDGTGKTTFINNLISRLQYFYNAPETRFNVHHFRPSLLPNLGAVGEKAKVMKQDKDFTNPHRAKPAGKISSLIRMVYYWMDYLIGVPFLLRKEVQYEQYTIFDRYIYDFLVDPKRSRISLPLWLRKQFVKCTIQPKVVFVLDADADTIYQRKQELTLNEINRQLIVFRNLTNSNKRFHKIDANKSPEGVVDQAIEVVFNQFLNRL